MICRVGIVNRIAAADERPLRNLYAATAHLYGPLIGARSSMHGMDFVAVALALVAFIALYGLIGLVDRV